MRGTIRKLEDGYGFIAAGGGRDLFFLGSALERSGPTFAELEEGQAVEFIPIDHPNGPRAIQVRVLHG